VVLAIMDSQGIEFDGKRKNNALALLKHLLENHHKQL
jgi:hypothetical protein